MDPPKPSPPLIAPIAAAGLALVLEYSGLTWREALPDDPPALAAVALGAGSMLLAGALTLELGRALLARVPPLARLGRTVATGRLGWSLFALLMLAGVSAWTADLVLYVRLYPGYHAALGAAALLAFGAAIRLALHRQGPLGADRWPALGLALLLSLVAGHLTLHAREDAKGAILSHGVIAADVGWLGDRLSDLDRDGVGWLFTAADPAPFDGAIATPDCLTPSADPRPYTWTPTAPAQPLNLLLITVDALRRDHTPSDPTLADPTAAPRMPALARFAGEAVVFRNAYAPAAMTLPSIAALHTGRYPWALAWAPTVIAADETVRHGDPAGPWPRAWPGDPRVGTPGRDQHPTLAEGLAAAGWRTAGWPPHESFLAPLGLGRGFETYPADIVRDLNPRGVEVTGEAVAARAARFITEAADRPFFAWVHLFDPHHPYRWPPGTDTTADTDLARYRAEVLYTDLQVARLLTLLRQTGLDRTTVVVFTADHGEAFGERGAGYHSTGLFDELTAVPLIIRAPGLAPRVVDTPVSLVDLDPTLGALLGVDPSPTWQGRDLGSLMRGESSAAAPVLSEVAYEDMHRQYLLRDGDWTLIWDWSRGHRQLFDLSRDPSQLHDRVVSDAQRADAMTDALCHALRATAGLAVPPAPIGPPMPLMAP